MLADIQSQYESFGCSVSANLTDWSQACPGESEAGLTPQLPVSTVPADILLRQGERD